MKIEFLTENMERVLPLLVKIFPTHTQIPVLSNILLEATKEGFFMSATDLEMATRIKIPAKIEEEGSTTVSGKHFSDVMNSLSKGRVKLEKKEEKIVLSSKDGTITFQTIPAEEFPKVLENKGTHIHSFTQKDIQDIFANVVFVASTDESRPELTGIYIVQKDTTLDVVATDGYRMSLERIANKKVLENEKGIIVSAKLITELLSLKEEGTIEMSVFEEGNQVLFEAGSIILVGRLIHGTFPSYERVIPQETKTTITFQKEEFLHALRLSSVFARESANIVKLTIKEGKMLFFARSQGVGEGEIAIDVIQEGDDNDISFNVKYLTDLLRNIQDPTISLAFNSPTEAALFTLPKNKTFLHVIMPVRVQE